ncbi:MAG: bifunctional DNA-binding transcriptional regulator/O6-methylguanine-DNA methyltransferase Ada [Bryobacterales bacterium]|nr:bifunctional DNA-binding transcriptional regulator/O6-methylguanine-DNA methyltransferase Ada [Bryobacterales bacterium]
MLLNEEICWAAVRERDRFQDGRFLYGVLTTRVYCRPSCASRRPRRENVRFYESWQAAEADGLRECLRCRPKQAESRQPDWLAGLCRRIEARCDEPLPLAELSRMAGVSAFHLQRQFKAATGLTPRQYVHQCRMALLKTGLRVGTSVTEAVFAAGYGSMSRVYEGAGAALGMTPAQYGKGGAGLAITWAVMRTRFGLLLVAATDTGLCAVEFGAGEAEMVDRVRCEFPKATMTPLAQPYPQPFHDWAAALEAYLEDRRAVLDLPLTVRATAFQTLVWNYLRTIPRGETRSYQEVAREIGRPSAARAVARACASNRLALLIPCHRVLRGDGELGGYRWGVARKQALLDWEESPAAGD